MKNLATRCMLLAGAVALAAGPATAADEDRSPRGGDEAARELRHWLARCRMSVKATEERVAVYRRQLKKLPKPSASETAEDQRCRTLGEASPAALQPEERAFKESRCFCLSGCARTGSPAHANLVRRAMAHAEEDLAENRRRCDEAGAALSARERETR